MTHHTTEHWLADWLAVGWLDLSVGQSASQSVSQSVSIHLSIYLFCMVKLRLHGKINAARRCVRSTYSIVIPDVVSVIHLQPLPPHIQRNSDAIQWQSHAERRCLARLTIFFKIHHHLVSTPMPLTSKNLIEPMRTENSLAYNIAPSSIDYHQLSSSTRSSSRHEHCRLFLQCSP